MDTDLGLGRRDRRGRHTTAGRARATSSRLRSRASRARPGAQCLHRRHGGARAGAARKRIDAARAAGKPLGPLAGVPFAVKNLFDVDGPADARRLEDQPRAAARARTTRR